jgi:hypothetical protein
MVANSVSPKNCVQALINIIRDVHPRSPIRIFFSIPDPDPDPGVKKAKKAPDPGSATLVTKKSKARDCTFKYTYME